MEIRKTRHLDRRINGLTIHYREAGTPSTTATVLLHGFPSSSHSFREVLPALAEETYVVAPDLPGFGFSDAPSVDDFEYTFENLSQVIRRLVAELGIERYVLYATDFGTPVAYNLATENPDNVLGIVIQNGNVHEEGLGAAWDAARRYWADPTPENRSALPSWLNFEGTKGQYVGGVPERLMPLFPRESWHLDWERLSRPGNLEAQFALFYDYRNHVARFPEIARYHSEHQPRCLVLWGRHDVFFDIEEVLAVNSALNIVETHIYDGGHFLTETHGAEVASVLGSFIMDVYMAAETVEAANA